LSPLSLSRQKKVASDGLSQQKSLHLFADKAENALV
jgi:hypothetical protein